MAPGLWWRSGEQPGRQPEGPARLSIARIPAATPPDWPAGLRVAGAWQLTSASRKFGGYSALLATPDKTLTAFSDKNRSMRFARPGSARGVLRFGSIGAARRGAFDSDAEAATDDPATGRRWFAYEFYNIIRRFDPGEFAPREVVPPAMADWPQNGGPEAMVRLADGRFIVLREAAPWLSAGARPALLFPYDPVDGATPVEFSFRPPIGYDPTDAAALPDGRVVILLRTLDLPFPPFFRSKLLVADPRDIEPGKPWPWQELATLHGPVPRDNYEGLAIEADPRGVTMWLISDDNSVIFQRTLLLELRWQGAPRQAIRRPRRPS